MVKVAIARSVAAVFLNIGLCLAIATLSAASPPAAAPFPSEGVWRGEFSVNVDKLPFNFEIHGKSESDATLTLITEHAATTSRSRSRYRVLQRSRPNCERRPAP
jgi:hypothetical protein